MIDGDELEDTSTIQTFRDGIPLRGRYNVHFLTLLPDEVDTLLYWSVATERLPRLSLGEVGSIIRIPAMYLEGSGIDRRGQDLVLYYREEMAKQIQAMKRYSVNSYAVEWITGAWGAGKPCTVLAFAYSLDLEKWQTVFWLHLDRQLGAIYCVWLANGQKRSCTIVEKGDWSMMQQVFTLLKVNGGKHAKPDLSSSMVT